MRMRHGGLALSQAHDPSLSRLAQLCGIEIKSPDGSYYASSVQLAIWLSAGLENMRLLKELATGMGVQAPTNQASLLPFIGLSIIGHVWNFHLAEKASDGTVIRQLFSLYQLFWEMIGLLKHC